MAGRRLKVQNSSFNMAMTLEKRTLVQKKEKMRLACKLVATDIIPLINRARVKSFARKDKNQVAIAGRGWNPYNLNLLLDPTIRATMIEQELAGEASNNLMPPCIHPCVHLSTHPSSQHNFSQQSNVVSLYAYANAVSSSTCDIVPPSSSTDATAASVSMFPTAQQFVTNLEVAKKLNYSSRTSTFCVDTLV